MRKIARFASYDQVNSIFSLFGFFPLKFQYLRSRRLLLRSVVASGCECEVFKETGTCGERRLHK